MHKNYKYATNCEKIMNTLFSTQYKEVSIKNVHISKFIQYLKIHQSKELYLIKITIIIKNM